MTPRKNDKIGVPKGVFWTVVISLVSTFFGFMLQASNRITKVETEKAQQTEQLEQLNIKMDRIFDKVQCIEIVLVNKADREEQKQPK